LVPHTRSFLRLLLLLCPRSAAATAEGFLKGFRFLTALPRAAALRQAGLRLGAREIVVGGARDPSEGAVAAGASAAGFRGFRVLSMGRALAVGGGRLRLGAIAGSSKDGHVDRGRRRPPRPDKYVY
jgi:hypothetical protein